MCPGGGGGESERERREREERERERERREREESQGRIWIRPTAQIKRRRGVWTYSRRGMGERAGGL